MIIDSRDKRWFHIYDSFNGNNGVTVSYDDDTDVIIVESPESIDLIPASAFREALKR